MRVLLRAALGAAMLMAFAAPTAGAATRWAESVDRPGWVGGQVLVEEGRLWILRSPTRPVIGTGTLEGVSRRLVSGERSRWRTTLREPVDDALRVAVSHPSAVLGVADGVVAVDLNWGSPPGGDPWYREDERQLVTLDLATGRVVSAVPWAWPSRGFSRPRGVFLEGWNPAAFAVAPQSVAALSLATGEALPWSVPQGTRQLLVQRDVVMRLVPDRVDGRGSVAEVVDADSGGVRYRVSLARIARAAGGSGVRVSVVGVTADGGLVVAVGRAPGSRSGVRPVFVDGSGVVRRAGPRYRRAREVVTWSSGSRAVQVVRALRRSGGRCEGTWLTDGAGRRGSLLRAVVAAGEVPIFFDGRSVVSVTLDEVWGVSGLGRVRLGAGGRPDCH